jgi:Fuc2NAc and GlcNAc transferase
VSELPIVLASIGLAFFATLVASGLYLKVARRLRLFDHPNERSAHVEPTPRGGGLGIFAGLYAALALPLLLGQPWAAPYPGLLLLATVLLLAGVVDDRYGLSVSLRLPGYALACAAMVWLVLGHAPLWLQLVAAVYALWLLNLFNFMDGIDGIAASEAGFVFGAAALVSALAGTWSAYALFCCIAAAACLAFLWWNWAPARLFMGDAGSVPLGFLLASLSLLGQASGAVPLSCWLILLAVFITDATYTLCWRAIQGERVTQAHSRHLYQRLARHWGRHSPVVLAMTVYNLLWLLPCAVAVLHWPRWTWAWVLAAYLPLLPVRVKADKLP